MRKRDKSLIEVLYQNDDVIVVNKPSGISVTHDRSGADDLPTVLSDELGLSGELRLVHRLDKDTSGVLLIARNLPAQSWLSSCFEKGLAQKVYLALVRGAAVQSSGIIESAIEVAPRERNKMQIARRGGKEAVTQWQLLADFGAVSLLAVRPRTGRTHQIRVHLASIGMPLAIDLTYGSSEPVMLSEVKQDYKQPRDHQERPLIERLTLHAYQINVPLKEGDAPSEFVAPLDERFKATIKMLAKHNKRGFGAFLKEGVLEEIVAGKMLTGV